MALDPTIAIDSTISMRDDPDDFIVSGESMTVEERSLFTLLREGLDFYLREEGEDFLRSSYSIWRGLGRQQVVFSSLFKKGWPFLKTDHDLERWFSCPNYKGLINLLALGLIQYLEGHDPENPIGAEAVRLGSEIAAKMDTRWGHRFAWDKSLVGLKKIGLGDFEGMARDDLSDETFERIKTNGETLYVGGMIIRKEGWFNIKFCFSAISPPPMAYNSYVWVGLKWVGDHWKITWSRGNHKQALSDALEKGPLASPHQSTRRRVRNRQSMRLSLESLDELKSKPADFLTTKAERFLGHPPTIGTRIAVSYYLWKDEQGQARKSLLLNQEIVNTHNPTVILFFNGEKWEVERQCRNNQLVEALTTTVAQKRSTDFSPERVALREKLLSDIPSLAPVVRDVKDLLEGKREPGSHFHHSLTLPGEGSFNLFGFMVPEDQQRGVSEVPYPPVTPNVPKPFLMLRTYSEGEVPSSWRVLCPTPQGFEVVESIDKGRKEALAAQLGPLVDLDGWIYEQALGLKPFPRLLEKIFLPVAFFKDTIRFLFPYFFRFFYLKTHSPLKAFLAARDQLKNFDPKAYLSFDLLQKILKQQGYSHYALPLNARNYEHWLAGGVDVDVEYNTLHGRGLNFTEILDELAARLELIGLPPLGARGIQRKYSLRGYLFFTLASLGKLNKGESLFATAVGEKIDMNGGGALDSSDIVISIGQLLRRGILSPAEATVAFRFSEGVDEATIARELGITSLACGRLKQRMAQKLLDGGAISRPITRGHHVDKQEVGDPAHRRWALSPHQKQRLLSHPRAYRTLSGTIGPLAVAPPAVSVTAMAAEIVGVP